VTLRHHRLPFLFRRAHIRLIFGLSGVLPGAVRQTILPGSEVSQEGENASSAFLTELSSPLCALAAQIDHRSITEQKQRSGAHSYLTEKASARSNAYRRPGPASYLERRLRLDREHDFCGLFPHPGI
jgi:hypothetical protein